MTVPNPNCEFALTVDHVKAGQQFIVFNHVSRQIISRGEFATVPINSGLYAYVRMQDGRIEIRNLIVELGIIPFSRGDWSPNLYTIDANDEARLPLNRTTAASSTGDGSIWRSE